MNRQLKILTMAAILIMAAAMAIADEDNGIRKVNNLNVDVWVNKGDGAEYNYGEDLAVYFQVSQDAYVVLYDIDPSGNVSLLFPETYDADCFVRSGQVYRVPDNKADYRLEVTGPSGTEYIYAVASNNYIRPPDFIKNAFYDYSDWDNYYNDDFVYRLSGQRDEFVANLNDRIANGPYVQASVMFRIDDHYRPNRWYRYWRYDPYYVGSAWIGADWPGCEVWIDGCYYGIAPTLIPSIYIGRHWVWLYYGGYPCWDDYFYVYEGQRCNLDVKIDHRDGRFGGFGNRGGNKFDYRGGDKSRRWDLKQDKYRNERDFKRELVKHPSNPRPQMPLPPTWVEDKYSPKHANDRDVVIPGGRRINDGSIDKFRPNENSQGINRDYRDQKTSRDNNAPVKIEPQRTQDKNNRSGESQIIRQPVKNNSEPNKQSEKVVQPQKQSENSHEVIKRESERTANPPSVKSEPVKSRQESGRSSEKSSQSEKRGKR